MSVNKVILVGNLTRDPELRSTSNGKTICSFSVATSESWKDKQSGEKKENVEFHNVVVFSDGLANVLGKYATKGTKVYVEGALQTDKYVDKSGVEKRTTKVVIKAFNGTVQMLGGKSESTPTAHRQAKQDAYQPKDTGVNPSIEEELDDSIPFR